MAGHSQFKNIMHRKGRQDAVKSKLFGKLAREITVAAKTGQADPAMNPRLRLAIQAARAENMPKDNIDRAIKKALGGDTEAYEQLRYEGYGPNGVAVIVEALTNNRNRTGSAVRAVFTKHGGNLGATGAVAHMFVRVGEIAYGATQASADDILEASIEAGADDVQSDDTGHMITCAFEATGALSASLEERFGEARSVKVIWKPQVTAPLDAAGAEGIMKLIAQLDDDDDVQAVFTNFEVDDATMAKLTEG